jgi:Fe-S cluster assembly protein SufB
VLEEHLDKAEILGMATQAMGLETLSEYKDGFHDDVQYTFRARKGLNREVVTELSHMKGEPQWMLDFRLRALDIFFKKPMPTWGGQINLNLDEITYYTRPSEKTAASWDDVPAEIKNTFDKLGIPEAERKFLAGVGAQYESEMVYHSVQKHLEALGVIFLSSDDGLRQYPDLFREHFSKVIPPADNKFAACNSAVWSGGSFVYVPKGVNVEMPLQAYFRLNAEGTGQFERTLIIVDEGARVHYVEGCTAPSYSRDSFHSGVIEIIVKKGARCRYTTIQNWSTNVYNLVTQRAVVHEGATMEWVDANLGSKLTMKYPSCYLVGEGAHGEILSMAFAGRGQHQDTGGKVIHSAPHTSSKITSKSISVGGGRNSYRGLVKVYKGAHHAKSNVVCDALLIDDKSRSDTYPVIEIDEDEVNIGHEASTSKIGEEQLFYLMSRGLSPDQAASMVVAGFIEPMVKELPMEYAVELNRLVQLQMEGSIG